MVTILALAACGGDGGSTGAAPTTTSATPAPTVAADPTPPPSPAAVATTASTPTTSGSGYGYDYGYGNSDDPAASPTPAPTASQPAPGEVPVNIVDFAFDPPTITVAPGTTVVWTNVGPTPHTTTSRDGVWDSAIMDAGAEFRFTFTEPGQYEYWCTLHPSMVGTIVVQ